MKLAILAAILVAIIGPAFIALLAWMLKYPQGNIEGARIAARWAGIGAAIVLITVEMFS